MLQFNDFESRLKCVCLKDRATIWCIYCSLTQIIHILPPRPIISKHIDISVYKVSPIIWKNWYNMWGHFKRIMLHWWYEITYKGPSLEERGKSLTDMSAKSSATPNSTIVVAVLRPIRMTSFLFGLWQRVFTPSGIIPENCVVFATEHPISVQTVGSQSGSCGASHVS